MRGRRGFGLRRVVLIGMLAALVYALSLIEVRIPVGFGSPTRIHFGNVMCLLSGLLFGPLAGGLASGIGSLLYDLVAGYALESFITFANKFAMGFLAGLLAVRVLAKAPIFPRARIFISALAGQLAYMALYLGKKAIELYILVEPSVRASVDPAAALLLPLASSGVNAAVAVTACTVLAPPLAAALKSSGLFAAAAMNNRPPTT